MRRRRPWCGCGSWSRSRSVSTAAAHAVAARVPPHSLEAERGLLGALLTSTSAVLELGGHLDLGDFYWQAHAEVYGAIRALFERNQPADLISVTEELTRRGAIERVGGA